MQGLSEAGDASPAMRYRRNLDAKPAVAGEYLPGFPTENPETLRQA
jgi:hypothetical protein